MWRWFSLIIVGFLLGRFEIDRVLSVGLLEVPSPHQQLQLLFVTIALSSVFASVAFVAERFAEHELVKNPTLHSRTSAREQLARRGSF